MDNKLRNRIVYIIEEYVLDPLTVIYIIFLIYKGFILFC